MKPINAIQTSVICDLTYCAFEDALIQLKCFPVCTLRVHPQSITIAQRVVGYLLPAEDSEAAVISPRVSIILDESYDENEWSVEYEGKTYWSPGV
jgi:hypothetical protein